MQIRAKSAIVIALCLITLAPLTSAAQTLRPRRSISTAILVRIIRAEDERRWDGDLLSLLTNRDPAIRARAALAAGRIGNEGSLAELSNIFSHDKDQDVREMAAFAIGEVESLSGANALLTALKSSTQRVEVRARAIEGLGKIAAALPKEQQVRSAEISTAITEALKLEMQSQLPNRQFLLLGITAILRSRPANAGQTLTLLLDNNDARIRADAGNALARIRAKDGNNKLANLLVSDPDPDVRANAARVLGATEEKSAFDKLLASATHDGDARVRVSAIRALATLKDPRAGEPLLTYGTSITGRHLEPLPGELNEVLEIATALGRLYPMKADPDALDWLHKGQVELDDSAPEVELAYVRISPDRYLSSFGPDPATAQRALQEKLILHWRSGASIAQALGEIANLPATVENKSDLMSSAESLLRAMLNYKSSEVKINSILPLHTEYGVPDVLRAYASYKPKDLVEVLSAHLEDDDVVVRATAADLLGDLPPSQENTRMLVAAVPRAQKDSLNDAILSILDSLAKQKNSVADEAIKNSLDSTDNLVRRRAVALLKANGAGDFSHRIGTVHTRNTNSDYQRAIARIGKPVRAVVTTTKGSFTIELLPDEAPLTVDNFVELARRGYYRGIIFHRVVPNFVVQLGDPRGDGSGGPGYTIRCEVNEVPYDRGAVGMALSGKDTGGSQWFVTHAPQPHLDGGYTVFGHVISGMNVVDSIVRGDIIRSIAVR
ncbi:MAG TPA: peptidylprolyl isomerase [Pyrinomonadaceae bacterium]|jgi:Peptidyl-prolyl cis-trans isomerase (rotamase) - cyclophilin family|nr:peptidylprolyl isomerase [Pyrinomonadaceae bacterium]